MLKMKFIKDRHSEEVAINPNNISSIRITNGVVYIHLCGDKAVSTNFKNIQEAWDAVT